MKFYWHRAGEFPEARSFGDDQIDVMKSIIQTSALYNTEWEREPRGFGFKHSEQVLGYPVLFNLDS